MCCLPEADTSQQLLERPASGKIINYRVRHDARDRPRATFFTAASALAAAAVCSRFLFCACRAQAFDSQQRAVRCDTATNDLLGGSLRHFRSVPRAQVVAAAASLLPGSSMAAQDQECLCTHAHAPSRRPQRLCASAVCPRWTGR